MAEIKVKPKGTIKKLKKEVVQVQKFKNNLITTKEKINEFTINENNNKLSIRMPALNNNPFLPLI